MAVDLIDESKLTAYITDLVYQGTPPPKQENLHGEFESPDYVAQNRDVIVKGILKQYIRRRLRDYMVGIENEPAFVLVDRNEPNLPGWVETVFAKGKKVYNFDATKMSDKLRDEIITVRDYLYEMAGQYVDKTAEIARRTKKKPKIRYDYLKTSNEYATFEMALDAAKKWHEHLAENLAKLNKSKEMLEKSLVGAVHVMDLCDGLSAYQLTTEEALDFESEYMGHCVGKGSYDAGVKDGSIKIYSIRDERGEPHATFEVRGNEVYQAKGKQNKALVRKYVPAAKMFVEQMKLDLTHDAKNLGLIKKDGKLYDIFNLPKNFVVKGNLDLSGMDLKKLPDLSTITVEGSFHCDDNQLTSLAGAPQSVGGSFYCSDNQLTSLEGAPQSVEGNFHCSRNQLTSLAGAPQSVGYSFHCSDNQLTSLEGAPQSVGGGFYCYNNKLTSLAGAPQSVQGDFECSYNQLTSLAGAPQSVQGDFECSYNQLTSLAGAPQSVGGGFYCSDNQLTSLEGAPQSVGYSFDCSDNQLTSLAGAPQSVGGDFNCYNNKLTSLAGAPQSVGYSFDCSDNQLTSLAGAPQSVQGDFDCSYNQLTSLAGAPNKASEIIIDNENLESLMAPEYIRNMTIRDSLHKTLTDKQKEIMIQNYKEYKKHQMKSATLKNKPQVLGDDMGRDL